MGGDAINQLHVDVEWSQPRPDHQFLSWVAGLAMVQLEARSALLKTVWLSLLAEPGTMLCVDSGGGAPKQYGFVLQATEWGVLAMDVVLQKSADHTFSLRSRNADQ